MLYSQLDTKKSRILEFTGFETTSVSSNYLIPFVGNEVANYSVKVEVYVGATKVINTYISAAETTAIIDLSPYIGTKKIVLNAMFGSVVGGQVSGLYRDVDYNNTLLGDEFKYLNAIYLERNIVNTISPNLTNLRNLSLNGNNTLNYLPTSLSVESFTNYQFGAVAEYELADICIASIKTMTLYNTPIKYTNRITFNPLLDKLDINPRATSDITTNSQSVSYLLQDLSASLVAGGVGRLINVNGNCAPPIYDTPTNNAIADLTAKGITVVLNP